MAIHVEMKSRPLTARYSLITAVLAWCALVVVSGLYMTLPMGSVLEVAFHATSAEVVWTNSAFSLTYALGFLIFGPLSDRYGRWPVMLSGLFALGVLSLLSGSAPNLSALIAFRSVQGLVSATFAPVVMAYIAEMFPENRRITAMGFVSSGFLLSAVVGQLFSSAVSAKLGWNEVFYVHGALALVTAVLFGRWVPKGEMRRSAAGMISIYKQIPDLLAQGSLVRCFLISATILLSLVGMYTLFEHDLTKAPFELTASRLMQVRAAGFAGMILSPFAGRLAAKFGIVRVLQSGLALAAAGLGLVGFSSNLPVLVVLSIVYIAGISLIIPTLISLIGILAGDKRGMAVTLYSLILFIGASAGPLITVYLLKAGGSFVAFETLAALLILAFCLSLFIRTPANSRNTQGRHD